MGRSIERVEVLHADLLAQPEKQFRSAVRRTSLGAVGRRGKNLLLELLPQAAGAHPRQLVINLGMSGRLLHRSATSDAPPPTHPGVRFRLDDGSVLVYHDIRRFGRLQVLESDPFQRWSRTLGPEPLGGGFTADRLRRDLAGSSAPIRSWLLDQRKIAGVGNIYANEALFMAGIDPRMPAGEVSSDRVASLHRALRSVLREAIEAQGTTLRDYRTAQGWEGSYAARLRVYGREGEPCPRCRTLIVRLVFGGRSAFLCPECQSYGSHSPTRG